MLTGPKPFELALHGNLGTSLKRTLALLAACASLFVLLEVPPVSAQDVKVKPAEKMQINRLRKKGLDFSKFEERRAEKTQAAALQGGLQIFGNGLMLSSDFERDETIIPDPELER